MSMINSGFLPNRVPKVTTSKSIQSDLSNASRDLWYNVNASSLPYNIYVVTLTWETCFNFFKTSKVFDDKLTNSVRFYDFILKNVALNCQKGRSLTI